MKICLVRHGQTDFNKLKLVQGWADNPLNDTGIEQATNVGLFFKKNNYAFDHIYTSPLIRAKHTAELINRHLEQPKKIKIDYHFLERDFALFEGNNVDETIKIISKEGFNAKGYEDNKLLLKRIENGLLSLYKTHKDETVMISCHSHVVKSFLILSDPEQYNYLTYLNNASVHWLSFDGEALTIDQFNIEAN